MGTHRNNPLLAATTYTRPVIVAELRVTLLVRAQDLTSHMALLQERLHPLHLAQRIVGVNLTAKMAYKDVPARRSSLNTWGSREWEGS